MSLQSDLIAAKALIDTPDKWGKGLSWNTERPCALEAIRLATKHPSFSFTSMPGWRALLDALPNCRYKTEKYVGGYNDDPATTHADIMALFDRAIAASA